MLNRDLTFFAVPRYCNTIFAQSAQELKRVNIIHVE